VLLVWWEEVVRGGLGKVAKRRMRALVVSASCRHEIEHADLVVVRNATVVSKTILAVFKGSW
jgi:hypothetical protein